jgi:hypothetical protein
MSFRINPSHRFVGPSTSATAQANKVSSASSSSTSSASTSTASARPQTTAAIKNVKPYLTGFGTRQTSAQPDYY